MRRMSLRDETGKVCCGQAQTGVSESYPVMALEGGLISLEQADVPRLFS